MSWESEKQDSNLYWAGQRRPAEDRRMMAAAGQVRQVHDQMFERRNIENILGRTLQTIQGRKNPFTAGIENLLDGLDFIGETAREAITGQQVPPADTPAQVRQYGDTEWNPRGGYGGWEGWPKYSPDIPEDIRRSGRHAWTGPTVNT